METSFFKFASLIIAALAFSPAVRAHDVNASEVKVYKKDTAVEIWQTMPSAVAHGLIETAKLDLSLDQLDNAALREISTGLLVSSESGACELSRQARRRVHHDEYIQIRFLFTCADGEAPKSLSMPWLAQTPEDHFAFLVMDQGRGERTNIVHRTNYIFPFAPE